jgi:curli biogenesis system outer membrane secretion channel CsgG
MYQPSIARSRRIVSPPAIVLVAGLVLMVAQGRPGDAQVVAPKATVTTPDGKSIEEAQGEAYDGPKARLAVTRFTDKTGKGRCPPAIGDGMADMLATALFHSNRFVVLERQTLGDVLVEQDLATGGRIKSGTEAPTGEIEGADLLVLGAVTEFEGAQSGVGGGIGGFRLPRHWGAILGGLAGALRRAHLAIDLRVVDAKTSRVVAATSVEGSATDVSLGGALAGAAGGGALAGALAGWSKTPTEKALRVCIHESVSFIASRTPTTYYRHRVPVVQTAVAGAPGPGAAAVANAVPASGVPAPTAAPPAASVLQAIRADLDRQVVAELNEVKLRGAVIVVVLSLRNAGPEPSEALVVNLDKSGVLDYASGEISPAIQVDGFTGGALAPGDVKTVRATFRAPRDAGTVGITLSGIGTFDDVDVAR